MGVGRSGNTVYLSDFGIAFSAYDNRTTSYATYRERQGSGSPRLIGNPPFASLMGHVAGSSTPLVLPTTERLWHDLVTSRSDDLESLGYVLVRFLTGSLPWDGLKADNRNEKLKRIQEMKEDFDPNCWNFMETIGIWWKCVDPANRISWNLVESCRILGNIRSQWLSMVKQQWDHAGNF